MITTVWGSPSQPGRAALPGDLGQLAADQRPVLDELVLVDSGHETPPAFGPATVAAVRISGAVSRSRDVTGQCAQPVTSHRPVFLKNLQ